MYREDSTSLLALGFKSVEDMHTVMAVLGETQIGKNGTPYAVKLLDGENFLLKRMVNVVAAVNS